VTVARRDDFSLHLWTMRGRSFPTNGDAHHVLAIFNTSRGHPTAERSIGPPPIPFKGYSRIREGASTVASKANAG
jgi:hypothetical protein